MSEEKDTILRTLERALLLILLSLIPITLIAFFIYGNHKFLFTIPILLSLSALIQLEIAGLFDYLNELESELSKIYDESGLTPSHITRRLYEFYDPEHPKWDFIKNYLTLLNKVYNKEFISREKVSSKDKADSENEETALTALVTLEKLVIGEANIILKELLKKAGNDPRKQQEAQKEYRKILTENQNVLKRYITVDNEAAAQ